MHADGRDASFDTRTQAHAALSAVVADQGTSLCCFSADFRAWPLDQLAFIRLMQAWALRDTKRPDAMRFLALDWSQISTRFPRFATFRRDFAHRVACRQIAETRSRGLVENGGVGALRCLCTHGHMDVGRMRADRLAHARPEPPL